MAWTPREKITGEMPSEHCVDDKDWINRMLGYLNKNDRSKVCDAYSKVFITAKDSQQAPHKKTNTARRAANIRLRKFIDKRLAVFNK